MNEDEFRHGIALSGLGGLNDTAARMDDGKTPWHLVPWGAVAQIVEVLDFGKRKYAQGNWRQGMAWSRVFSATIRHLIAWWWKREDIDQESGLSHLAHAACNILFLMHYQMTSTGSDDREK